MPAQPRDDSRRAHLLRRWWSNLHVATKGFVVVAVPVTSLVAVASVSFVLSSRVDQLRATASQLSAAVDRLDVTLRRLVDAEDAVRGYAATGDPVFLESYARARRALEPAIVPNAAADFLTAPRAKSLNGTGSRALSALDTLRLESAHGRLNPVRLDQELHSERSLVYQLRSQLNGIHRTLQGRLRSENQQLAQAQAVSKAVDVAGLAIGVLGGALVAYLFLSGIVGRIRQVAANAERLGGEQAVQPLAPSRDAIGVVQAQLEAASVRLSQRAEELREARDAAVASTKAKDEFISHMSHELRTPLTAVLGFGELLQHEENLGPQNTDSVDRIVRAGRHLLNLINDLLDISRIETGHLAPELRPVAIRGEVEEVTAILRPLAMERRITVEAKIGDLAAIADRQRVQQVLLNLVANAIKYNREGGRVVISGSERPGGVVRIEVRDTGAGIPAQAIDRLFVPFERLSAEHSGVQGSGMGLALSKALIEAMHGTVGVESTVGHGSTFWFQLPGPSSSAADPVRVEASSPES